MCKCEFASMAFAAITSEAAPTKENSQIHGEGEVEVRLAHRNLLIVPSEVFLVGSGCRPSGSLTSGTSFRNLSSINLNGNQLTVLPNELFFISTLRNLYVSNNLLESIPELIGQLKHLKVLSCEQNRIKKLPESIEQCKNLETLSLGSVFGGNELTTLPESIGELENLLTLNLDNNHLVAIPSSIGKLKKLQVLHCSHNKLETLPDEICCMTSLRDLVLSNNNICAIPSMIGHMPNLRVLNVANNSLTVLPGELCWIEQCLSIVLAGNPFLEPCHQHLEKINQSRSPMNEITKKRTAASIPHLKNFAGRETIKLMELSASAVNMLYMPTDIIMFLLDAKLCTFCRRPGFMYSTSPEVEFARAFGHSNLPFYVTNACGLCRINERRSVRI